MVSHSLMIDCNNAAAPISILLMSNIKDTGLSVMPASAGQGFRGCQDITDNLTVSQLAALKVVTWQSYNVSQADDS